eukprot:scaffold5069_cov202-Prasinococcus_capsulatus_cf.AAC.1
MLRVSSTPHCIARGSTTAARNAEPRRVVRKGAEVNTGFREGGGGGRAADSGQHHHPHRAGCRRPRARAAAAHKRALRRERLCGREDAPRGGGRAWQTRAGCM